MLCKEKAPMKRYLTIFLLAVLTIIGLPRPPGQSFDLDYQRCGNDSIVPQVMIEACTRQIQSGRRKGADLAVDFYSRGLAYSDAGHPDRAIRDYDQAIRLDGKLARAYNNRGYELYKKGQLDLALRDFNQAIRLDPRDATAHSNWGQVISIKGDPSSALIWFDLALIFDPEYCGALGNRGVAYEKLGQRKEALKDFKKMKELCARAPWLTKKLREYDAVRLDQYLRRERKPG